MCTGSRIWTIAIYVIALGALMGSCNHLSRGTFTSIELQFAGAKFYYDIYLNQPSSEKEQLLVLRNVESLSATYELNVDGAGPLVLNAVNIDAVQKWGENTKGFVNHFTAGKGGEIRCNSNAVLFEFKSDGTVERIRFDTKYNPMPVKIRSKSGEATWPCSREELKRLLGKPDKEVISEGKVQGP
jgi:hypothetical protein